MRKDYLEHDDSTPEDESLFVEEFWTDVWDKQGGPKENVIDLSRKDEYRIIEPYLSSLNKEAKILDGGCGLGDWVLALHKKKYDVTGMDLSRVTVDKLQGVFPELRFEHGDIRKTRYADEVFDAYYSWGVFEHFESGPGDCIKEAFRILKPGGILFISVPLDNLRQSIRGTFASPSLVSKKERFYQYRFTRLELARELSLFGFESLDFRPIHKRQGVLRSLHHEFGLPYSWLLTRGLSVILAPFLPGWCFAHMMLAVARKPA